MIRLVKRQRAGGGDGEAANPLAAVLGLGVFAGTITTLVALIRLLEPPGIVVTKLFLVTIGVGTMWYLSGHENAASRRRLVVALAGCALALPVLVAVPRWAASPSPLTLAIAGVPPCLSALAFVAGAAASSDGGVRQGVAVLGMLVAPMLLAVSTRCSP